MSEGLKIVRHPYRFRILWATVYISAAVLVTAMVVLAATGIRTHSLPTGSVKLSIPYSKYTVGETISFTVQNNYNSSIDIINNCPGEPLAVYYQTNGSWVRQHDRTTLDECPNEDRQVSIKAGGSAVGNFDPWHNLFSKPGKYRIVAFVEYYNALPYQDIEVVSSTAKSQNSSSASSTKSTTSTSDSEDEN